MKIPYTFKKKPDGKYAVVKKKNEAPVDNSVDDMITARLKKERYGK